MSEAAPRIFDGEIAELLSALVLADGTGNHAHATALRLSAPNGAHAPVGTRSDLADAAHYLTMLHGRQPGVIDHAATRTTDNAARAWLLQAADAFGTERAFLTQVTVALGPLPSTAGQADCDTTVLQQRHALDMLAQSDRRGCAMGAAMALVLDWQAIRKLLDIAAIRVGIEPTPCLLPNPTATMLVANAVGSDEGSARALQFGARQLLSQHRGLWDLLHARAEIRNR